MRQVLYSCFLVALIGTIPASADAAVVYSQDFETNDTANWTINDPALSDVTADFFYDYSAIGVPNAPGGNTSRGMKLTANNVGGVFSGFSVSPTGQSFTGSYRIEFNLWQNYVGPVGPGGSGTTQLSGYGFGTSGTVAIWPASTKESVGFAHTLDGGSAADYRVYSSAANTGHTVAGSPGLYLAESQNESAAYYAALGQNSAPAQQVTLFPGQTGQTDPGEAAFAWRNVLIDVDAVAQTARWSIDGLDIAELDLTGLTFGGQNIFFAHSDTNAGISTDPNRALLNITLIDNIRVTSVPEPTGMSCVCVCLALAAMRRYRRRH